MVFINRGFFDVLILLLNRSEGIVHLADFFTMKFAGMRQDPQELALPRNVLQDAVMEPLRIREMVRMSIIMDE